MRQQNEDVYTSNGVYVDLAWEYLPSLMTAQAVTKIGMKNFPQIGAIGFYTLKYENRSVILAPLLTEDERYAAPSCVITTEGSETVFTISDPSGVTFECYRVVIRDGYFAEEYITYENVLRIPLVDFTDKVVYVMGYLEERLASQIAEVPIP